MGKIYLTPVGNEIYIGDISPERYDQLQESEDLADELDTAISDALSEIEYELHYKEEK